MNEMPLLSGPAFGSSPFTQTRPQRRLPLLRILVFAWLLVGLAFVAVRLMGDKSDKHQPAEAVQHTTPPVAASGVEDLLHHVDAVMDRTTVAAGSLRRAEDQISRALPVVERNTLLVEKRRLESSLAVIEAARRDLEQNRQDLELISNSIKEHRNK